jgi:hypothetical protein
MNKFLFFIVAGLFFLEFSLLPLLVPSFSVMLMFGLIVSLVLIFELSGSLWWILLISYFIELYTVNPFPATMAAIFLAALLIGIMQKTLLPDKRNYFLLFGVFLVAYFTYFAGVYVFSRILEALSSQAAGVFTAVPGFWSFRMILICFFSSLAGLFIFKLIDKLDRKYGGAKLDIRIK